MPASDRVTIFTELATLPTKVPGAVSMAESKVKSDNEVDMAVVL